MDQKAIIKGCFNKKTNCQKLLYEQYYGYALKIAFRYIHGYERAAALVNEGFAEFFIDIDSYIFRENGDWESVITSSIKKLIVDKAVNALLPNRSKQETPIIYDNNEDMLWLNHESNSAYKQLILHLKSLAPWYRILFNMHVIDGFSIRQIAECLRISMSTCESDLFQARVTLQKLINEDTVPLNKKQPLAVLRTKY